MVSKIIWFVIGLVTLFLLFLILTDPRNQLAGDIPEYFGITETLINHFSFDLQAKDQSNLEQTLTKQYFSDPQYYIQGADGARYPVHFVAYSFMAAPVRLMLRLIGIDELKALPITNLILFTLTTIFILKFFPVSNFTKIVFLLLTYLSPLVYFTSWPGPEIYSAMFLLLALFLFHRKEYLTAAMFATSASWQSQPLMVVAGFFIAFYFYSQIYINRGAMRRKKHAQNYREAFNFSLQEGRLHLLNNGKDTDNGLISFSIQKQAILYGLLLIGLLFSPMLYNLIVFGMPDPWLLLAKVSFWTQFFGFGIHNMKVGKFFELLADPNIGLLWYAPVLTVTGIFSFLVLTKKDRRYIILPFFLLLTIAFYQTNPNWHNGTAGFGPTRYGIFLIPFFIFFTTIVIRKTFLTVIVLSIYVLTQIYVLSFNGVLPNFENTHYHTPYARFLLEHMPGWYNPTAEIFVERTNHMESNYWTGAIYKIDGLCKKSFILRTNPDFYQKNCRDLTVDEQKQLDNPLQRATNFSRKLYTVEATLHPLQGLCDQERKTGNVLICLKSVEEIVNATGITDISRLEKNKEVEGIWKILWGAPLTIQVPAGYTADYYSFDGAYVTN